MTTEFIDERVWPRLKRIAKKCRRPASVAVAYLGKGAAKMLPLRKGSRLVVDASEVSVKGGRTCPADLLRLQERGVRVFSVQNLHAKVYVFGGQAFIGSSNASQHSASTLKEAVLRTTDREAVKAARAFVRGLSLQELGPKALKRLAKLYQPPKFPGGKKRRRSAKNDGRARVELSGMRLIKLVPGDPPKGSESAEEQGRQAAESKRKHPRTHFVDDFHLRNSSIRPGETVIQVVDEGDGPAFVSPPGEVINTKKWSNGRKHRTFVYLEVPQRRRVRVNKLAKRLGRGATKRLQRSGRVGGDFAEKLHEAWQR